MFAMRHPNGGRELARFGDVTRGFEAFAFRAKIEDLARAVRTHGFDFDGSVRGDGARLFALVVEIESEARQRVSVRHGNFDEAVAKVHKRSVVRSAFDCRVVMRVFSKEMKMAASVAANALNHKMESENEQRPARNP